MRNNNRMQTKQNHPYRAWQRVVSALACTVMLITSYGGMILPVKATEQTAYCGHEEHQHSQECYEKRLICGHEETSGETHVHTAECYQQQRVLICGLEEAPGHIHDESCVQKSEGLTCGKEETPPHAHTESCVKVDKIQICTDESEGHVHSDGCYQTKETYICGKTAGEGGHTHGPECYGTVETYTCGKEAGEGGHTHGESCYETRDVLTCEIHVHTEACYEEVLVCDQEEHTHSLSCFSDPEADVESETVWENSVSGVALTGVWAEDVIAIAESQLGYTESERNYTVTGDGARKGYTRYGDWYGDPYGDWSAMFVSFCLYYAGISRQSVPYASDCAGWVGTLSGEAWGLYRSMEGNSPQKGDIVFLDTDADGSADQAGLVASVSGGSLRIIAGDSENSVRTVSCAMSSDSLLGFAALPENPNNLNAQTNDAALFALEGDDGAVPADGAGDLTITLGQTLNVDVPAGETVKIPFTPEYTHQYIFQSTGTGDTYGYIYDANGNQLAYNDDGGGSGQFKITYTLNAGVTYYLGVRWYSSSSPGTIPVMLTYGGHVFTEDNSGQYVCSCGETAEGDKLDITLGKSLCVNVAAGETVKISFVPEYTHQYIFQSTGTGGTYGYLYDANGNQLTSSSGGSSGQFKITYTLTAGETYYLGVSWYSGSSTGTIPVLLTYGSLHFYTKNDSGQYICACGEPAPYTTPLGETLNVDVAAGEIVTIPFVPEYTHQYVFQSMGTESVPPFGHLYDANGNHLTSNGYSGGSNQFRIAYTLTAGETYYLGVSWASDSSSGTIPVLLTYGNHSYTKDGSGQYVCGCGETAPYSITLNQSLDVDVTAGEMVTIPFVPAVTHQYVFQSTGTGGTYGYLYNAQGNQLTSSSGWSSGQFRIEYTLTAGETYYLGVRWYSSSSSGTIPVLLTYGSAHLYIKNDSGQYVCSCGETASYSITLDETVNVDVAAGETVRIPFVPAVTHQYVFQSTGTGDTYGYIFDADGNQLAYDGYSGGNNQFRIAYTLTAGETYYVGVSWASGSSSGTIPVLLTYGIHPYTKNENGQYVCGCGETASYTITLGETVNIDVVAGKIVTIPFVPEVSHQYVFQSTGEGGTYGYIFDGDGKQIVSEGGSNQSRIAYTLTAGETYYLGVRWYSSSSSGTISVSLTYGIHSYTKNESGQFACTACGVLAQNITLGQTLDVDVAAGETVRIPFEPEYTHQYVFQSTGTGGTYGYLYDANGNQLAYKSGPFSIIYTLNAGETYYLGVRWKNSGSSGSIPVLLAYGIHSFTKNDSGQFVCGCGEAAPTISLGQTLNVNVFGHNTVKIPFVPEYTHEYVFQSVAEYFTNGYLYDAYGNQLAYSSGGSNRPFRITNTLTAGETYYLGVSWSGSINSGTIPILLTYGNHSYSKNESGQFACTICGELAPTITLGQTLDVDVYGQDVVKILFVPEYTHEYIFRSTGEGDPCGYIFDADGNQLAYDDYSGGNNQFRIAYTLTAGEAYYLGIRWSGSSNSGAIPILLTYGIHSYNKNESGLFACSICGELAQNITLGQTLDVDVAAGETVRIPFEPEYTHQYVFQSTGTGETYGYLYDANGNQLVSNGYGSSQFKIAYTLNAGETYYLGVKWYSSSSSGTIPVLLTYGSVHSYAKNDSGQFACTICGELAPTVTLGQTLDVDVYRQDTVKIPFVPEYTHEYIFQSTGTGDTYGYIYDANDNVLAYDDSSGGSGQFKITYTLNAGVTYYLGVRWYRSGSVLIPILLTYGAHSYNKNEYVCSGCGELAPTEGTCGQGITWRYEDGTLTISGNGAMENYSKNNAPWEAYKSDIAEIFVVDGVSSIGSSAFYGCSSLTSVTIPEGVTSIGSSAFSWCSSLTSVTIPDSVTSIGNQAFYNCSSLTSVTIPDGVTSIGSSAFEYCSSLASVTIPDGVTSIGAQTFDGCSSLTSVTIPDSVTSIGSYAFDGCSALTSVKIPKNVKTIGSNPFSGCSRLRELVWDAEDAALTDSNTSKVSDFTLVIGKNVDNISVGTFATLVKMGAKELRFEKPNYLTLPDVHVDALGLPLCRLAAGDYYVDAQGVLYRIQDGAASLVYWPSELTQCTVPANVPDKDGEHAPVTCVDRYAFAAAQELTTITFAEPENITVLRDFAFANARALANINGADNETEVLATFPNASIGVQLFENTQVSYLDNATGKILETKKENVVLKISTATSVNRTPAMAEDHTYQYYTGETATTSVTISNPDGSVYADGTIVRIIYKFDRSGVSQNYKPGSYTLKATESQNTYQMTITEFSLPNCYVIDIERPRQGDTLSVNFTAMYPSPTSAGGNAMIWGGILTAEEVDAQGSALLPQAGGFHRINWSTQPDTFPVTKSLTSAGSAVMRGDGEGGAYISGLSYKIGMSRDGDTLEGIGKDFITSVDFRDVLTLPEGVELSQELIEAVQKKSYTTSSGYPYVYFELNGADFLRLYYSTYYSPESRSLEIDENGNLVLNWTMKNGDLKTEIPTMSFTCSISDEYVLIPEPQEERTYTVNNQVTATQHYMYSADQVQSAECPVDVAISEGRLGFGKTKVSGGGYFGSPDCLWRITATNPGVLPYKQLASIEDELPAGLWLSGEQLAALFAADTEHQLAVTISRATLCEPHNSQTVTGIDGTSAGNTSLRNTGSKTPYSGLAGTDLDTKGESTITLVWDGDGNLLLTLGEGENKTSQTCAADGTAIQAVLDKLGFVVTRETRYKLCWDLRDENGNPVSLVGGGSIVKEIPCSVKDTFMLLNQDQRICYPDSSDIRTYNYAYAYDNNRETLKSGDDYFRRRREFSLTKGWSWNGQAVEPDSPIKQGDVVNYSLTVQHSGTGSYDVLPLTDHMTGGQALLVPVSMNRNADWAAMCQTVTVEDAEYYLLTEPGTYSHVWTSDTQLADTVTVTKTDSGFDTLMKWYFTDYIGSRTDTVSYQAYVCPNLAAPGAVSYSLGNESWLNDHATHRLYDVVGWWGTTFRFDKKIVGSVNDTGEGTVHSYIHEGETVIYRLMLESGLGVDGNPVTLRLTGNDMYDALPLSIDSYRWSEENVHIFYQKETDDYHVVNGNSWYINTAEGTDQQLLKWNDDFSITFRGRVYIYVTLDFPEGISWQNYAAKYGGTTTMVNTYHVFNAQISVTHELSISAQARLQKGVYCTGYYYSDYSYSNSWTPDCRLYYNNDDSHPRYVDYYVSLYNGGMTNLYLTDMQDRLPKGFTLWESDSNSTPFYVEVYRSGESKASYKCASISSSIRTVEGTQYITFHFGTGNDSRYPSVQYDTSRGMCFLAPGEAIMFTYRCQTNQETDTDDAALNTISMPYYDYNGGGVQVDNDCRIVVKDSDKYTPNDGGCEMWNYGQAQSAGLSGGATDTQWLTSQVTVVRGGIKPGITKALTSKTDANGIVTQNPVSTLSTDTLTWTVTAENDGTLAITDYVLTDVMQVPYGFTGNVDYRIYTSGGTSPIRFPRYGHGLFEITTGDDNTIQIAYPHPLGEGVYFTAEKELTIDGTPSAIGVAWHSGYLGSSGNWVMVSIQLSFSRDEAGNLVMSIHFPKEMAIPEHGRGVLTLSTKTPSSTLENKQFVNTAYITPLTQTWDCGTNKGNMTTLTTPFADSELPSVRNSAPVTTAYGYMTSSSIRVTEVDNPANTAASTEDPNYIVLENTEKLFNYTLSVENTTPKAMNELILISNLPQTGDHSSFLESDPRFSEFKVSLADSPNFTVMVKAKDGTVTTLDSSQYTVEFSDKTEFDASDWNGTSTWDSASADSTRSVRMKISDEAGTMIPEGSTVSLTFTCEIEGDAEPGATAWNSFGYHYRLKGESFDLEAAPLKVGVKTPSVPELKKRIVDHTGKEITVEEDTEFPFLVYQGAALTGDYDTEEALTEELDKQGVSYQKYTVTVPAGQSQSLPVPLAVEGWKWTADQTWTKGQQYTVTELPCDETYAFSRFQGSTGTSYTFTYDPAQNQVITCDNTSQDWTVALTKVNTSEEPLSGAVFALYSPAEQDRISEIPEAYQELSLALTLQRDNKTWYLKAVETTGEEGKLVFSGLKREKYYLLEVKPPVGYKLSDLTGQLLEQKYEVQGVYEVTVVNRREIDLPKTGGIGIDMLYTVGGILLIQCAVIFLLTGRNGRATKKKGRNQP